MIITLVILYILIGVGYSELMRHYDPIKRSIPSVIFDILLWSLILLLIGIVSIADYLKDKNEKIMDINGGSDDYRDGERSTAG